MAYFPTTLVEQVRPVTDGIGGRGNAALSRLNERGFTVATGLTEYFAGQLGILGAQPHIREYCPRDMTPARFGTLPSTRAWQAKSEGRAPFLLLDAVQHRGQDMGHMVDGYGWSGTEPCEFLPDHPITTAFRLTERGLRKGLFADFVQVITSATVALYTDGEDLGLETWQSNTRAISAYEQVGYELVNTGKVELRPTLNPDLPGAHMTDKGLMVPDQRLYMGISSQAAAA